MLKVYLDINIGSSVRLVLPSASVSYHFRMRLIETFICRSLIYILIRAACAMLLGHGARLGCANDLIMNRHKILIDSFLSESGTNYKYYEVL